MSRVASWTIITTFPPFNSLLSDFCKYLYTFAVRFSLLLSLTLLSLFRASHCFHLSPCCRCSGLLTASISHLVVAVQGFSLLPSLTLLSLFRDFSLLPSLTLLSLFRASHCFHLSPCCCCSGLLTASISHLVVAVQGFSLLPSLTLLSLFRTSYSLFFYPMQI